AQELVLLLAAGLFVGDGLYLVHKAKAAPLPEAEAGLAAKRLLNLNALGAREDVLPALTGIPNRAETARRIYYSSGSLPNVGAIRQFLTGEQFRQLKPLFVVRRPAQFERAFYLWAGIFFAAFVVVHLYWSLRGFGADQTILPATLLLSGIGLILMISLRDPLRD